MGLVARDCNCHNARRRLEAGLRYEFDIDHTTHQVNHEGGDLLSIGRPEGSTPIRLPSAS